MVSNIDIGICLKKQCMYVCVYVIDIKKVLLHIDDVCTTYIVRIYIYIYIYI